MYRRFSDAVADILSPAVKEGQTLYGAEKPPYTDITTVSKKIEVLIQRYKKTYHLRPEQVSRLKEIVMEHYDNCRASTKK